MQLTSRIALVPRITFATTACALTLFLVWTSHRAFGIWDEGYYLIMSLHPEDVGVALTSYYYYTGFLFSLSHHDIAIFRILGLVCLLAATILLSSGLRAIDTHLSIQPFSSRPSLELISILFIGALVYYASFALATPSYNLLNSVLLTGLLGATFHSIASSLSGNCHRATAWSLLTGVLTGIDFFTKAPSAALMFFTVLATAATWPNLQSARRCRLLLTYALGTLAWFAFHFCFIENLTSFLEKIRLAREYEKHQGIGLTFGHDILRYVLDFRHSLWLAIINSKSAVIGIILLLLFFALSRYYRPRFLIALCWAATLLIARVHFNANYHRGGYTHTNYLQHMMEYYLSWGLLLSFTGFVLSVSRQSSYIKTLSMKREDIILILTLAVVPFVGAIGTHSPLGYNLPLTLATWFAFLVYLAARIEAHGLPLRVPAQCSIAVFAAVQLVTAYWSAPYEADRGVAAQTHLTTLGDPPTQLLLDRETHEAINSLKSIAAGCHLKTGDYILGFYQVPGIVYALGGRTLVCPAFIGSFKGTLPGTAHEAMLKALPYSKAHNAFLLAYLYSNESIPNLQAIGRTFPDDYELCGETVWPASGRIVGLWKPLNSRP